MLDAFVKKRRKRESRPQTLSEIAKELRQKTISSVQEKVKSKGGLEGVKIFPEGKFTVIPESATAYLGFEKQLGTGKMKDTFGVPFQGLGEGRYRQSEAIGMQDLRSYDKIEKATKNFASTITTTTKKAWKKTEVIPQ
ncbi:unnamed protein product, partial [marine sediment metagenome]